MTKASAGQVRVTGLEARLIATGIKMKRSQGIGSVQGKVKRILLRLQTDAGVVGIGEAAPWEVFSGTAEAALAALDLYLRPIVVGADPRRIQSIMAACDRALYDNFEAKAAVEMALFDICGKLAGLPVSDLLGGAVRDRIPMSFSIANPDIDADVAMAKRLHGEGVRIFKVKTGFSDHANDMRRLTKLRKELPDDIDLRVDYNQGLQSWEALPKLREIEQFKPTFIEQPVPRPQLDVMAALTAALDTPVMADEAVFSPAEALRLVEKRAADIVSVKLMKSGGILNARKINAICETAGIPCYGGTLWEGGVALAAGALAIAATANMSLGCEFYMPKFVLEEDVLTEIVPIEDGHVVVPKGPGLGVTLNEDAVERLTIEKR